MQVEYAALRNQVGHHWPSDDSESLTTIRTYPSPRSPGDPTPRLVAGNRCKAVGSAFRRHADRRRPNAEYANSSPSPPKVSNSLQTTLFGSMDRGSKSGVTVTYGGHRTCSTFGPQSPSGTSGIDTGWEVQWSGGSTVAQKTRKLRRIMYRAGQDSCCPLMRTSGAVMVRRCAGPPRASDGRHHGERLEHGKLRPRQALASSYARCAFVHGQLDPTALGVNGHGAGDHDRGPRMYRLEGAPPDASRDRATARRG